MILAFVLKILFGLGLEKVVNLGLGLEAAYIFTINKLAACNLLCSVGPQEAFLDCI